MNAENEREELDYGAVACVAGRHKGRIFYYDDDHTDRTAICYVGHPLSFCGTYDIRKRFLRDPTVDDLLRRQDELFKEITEIALRYKWKADPKTIYMLWAERELVANELIDRRLFGESNKMLGPKRAFLCHSSADKGLVRRLHDDLKKRGVDAWLDENEIDVGESIVDKISSGLHKTNYMIICLTKTSIESLWAKKEWQAFLSRQLSNENARVLPALFDDCAIPAIIKDIKYADFRENYNEGFGQIHRALRKDE